MRKPSIHITKDTLFALLEEYDLRHDMGIDIDDLVNYLLQMGKVYQIENRIPLAETQKQQKQVVKGTMSTKQATSMMAKSIHLIRQKDNKHIPQALIKENNADWNKVREIAELATRFCDAYDLPYSSGFNKYINIYMLIKTKSFNLSIFNARHEYICETYEAQLRLESTDYKDDVERAHEVYQRIVFEKTGQQMNFKNNPVKHACFIDAATQAKEMNITPEDYIEAGFNQLEYKNSIPTVTGFGTDMYKNRVIKWMAENNYVTAEDTSFDDRYEDMLKKARDDYENSSE